jgi:hypothetical protein
MADLGAIGARLPGPLTWSLGRESFVETWVTGARLADLLGGRQPQVLWSLGRESFQRNWVTYRLRARLLADLSAYQALEIDFHTFAGSVSLSGSGVAREVRVFHRDTGKLIAKTTSSSSDGSFSVRVPSNLELDVKIVAQVGDGCDIYLPSRTPVDV